MVDHVIGNLLTSNCEYICHQVNCQGRMGSGIAKQIREKWPEVYEVYSDHCNGWFSPGDERRQLLGSIDMVHRHDDHTMYIINMYSQQYYGYDGTRYTSYDAFSDALNEIKNQVPRGSSIGFPHGIGCGLGGGNWQVISALIEEILGDDYNVYIYKYYGE